MNWYKFNISSFSEEEYDKCLLLMERSRLERIKNISHEGTRRMSVFAEWKAKNLISETLNIPLPEVDFCYSEKGKPHLKDGALHFSISHSGDWAAVAVNDTPIGIDIEVLRPVNPRLKRKICSDKDLTFLSESEGDEKAKLLKIWTAKEAYFKKTGTGIADFKAVSYVDISPLHFFEDNLVITIV